MSAWQAGMLVGGRRITCRSGLWTFIGAALCVLGAPVVLPRTDVVRQATFGLVLPLFAYFLVARVVREGPIGSSVQSLGRVGYNRRAALLSLVLTVVTSAAVAGASFAALGEWATARSGAGHLATICLVGAAGGASYAALFCWGASVGSKGGGRLGVLGLDWLFGLTSAGWALPWPRAHLRSLLGGETVLGLAPPASALVLVLLILMATTWTAARTPP